MRWINLRGLVNGLGQDGSVGLYNFRIILYLGVCTSIVTHCCNGYGSSFSIAVDKKIKGEGIKRYLLCSINF